MNGILDDFDSSEGFALEAARTVLLMALNTIIGEEPDDEDFDARHAINETKRLLGVLGSEVGALEKKVRFHGSLIDGLTKNASNLENRVQAVDNALMNLPIWPAR